MRKIELNKQNKQVVLLYISTLGGTLLGVLSSIINTRYLDTASYGDIRYVQNIITFVASLLLFGYFLSGSRLLALSSGEEKSRRIRGCMVVILAITSFVLLLSCAIMYMAHRKSSPEVAYLFIVSMPVCFYPLFSNYINTTAQGDNHIGRLSVGRLLPLVIYIPIAYLVYSTYGASSIRMILLQWGTYTVIFTAIIVSTRPTFQNLRPIFSELQQENKEYGFQLYIGSLFMVASGYLAGIFLGLYNEDNTEVGFYTLALTITSPLALLPGIIGTTYFKKFATEPKIPDKVMKFTLLLSVLSCILFILLIRPVVTFLYSDRYVTTGIYASWMAVGYSIHGLGDMINRYLGSHGQGKSIRNSSIINGVFKIFGFTVLVYYFNTFGALITNITCSSIYCIILAYYYFKFIKKTQLYEKI